MSEREYEAESRIGAWIRDFGKDKSPVFIEDLQTLLAELTRLRAALADAEITCANHGASVVAEIMKGIAEKGTPHGKFGGEDIEACAQAILKLRAVVAEQAAWIAGAVILMENFEHLTNDHFHKALTTVPINPS